MHAFASCLVESRPRRGLERGPRAIATAPHVAVLESCVAAAFCTRDGEFQALHRCGSVGCFS